MMTSPNLFKPTQSTLSARKDYFESMSKVKPEDDPWWEQRPGKKLPDPVALLQEEQQISAKKKSKANQKEQLAKKKFPNSTRLILRILDGQNFLGTDTFTGCTRLDPIISIQLLNNSFPRKIKSSCLCLVRIPRC